MNIPNLSLPATGSILCLCDLTYQGFSPEGSIGKWKNELRICHHNRHWKDDIEITTRKSKDNKGFSWCRIGWHFHAAERPLTLVKLPEIWTSDWPNTNVRLEIVISTMALLNVIWKLNAQLTGTPPRVYLRHELPPTTFPRKLVYHLRAKSTQTLPTTTCTL